MAEGIDFKLTEQNKKTLILVALVVIPVFLAFFFRAYPATLPITDQWAQSSVEGQVKAQIEANIRGQFPNLPQEGIQSQINAEYEKVLAQQESQIENQIVQASQYFKSRLQNANGETYLLAIDPWTYYMDSVRIVKNGYPGDEIRDGKPWDTRLLAPLGKEANANLHSYVNIWTWKVLSMFKNNMSIMGGAFWVPAIIASLSVIPAFFIARRKAGNLGGFIAACILGVHTAFLGRTPAGFSDTDAYNVFFPLLVTWLFLEAFEAKDIKKKLGLAALAGLALGVYSKIWVGYWYILDIIIVAVLGYIGFIIVRQLYQNYNRKQEQKNPLKWDRIIESLKTTGKVFGTFYIVTGIIVTLLVSFESALTAPFAFVDFSQLKVAANPDLWPNVLTTVAELNKVNFAQVVAQMGGKFLFWLALIGASFSILPKKLKSKDYVYIAITLFITFFLVSDTALKFSEFTYLAILAIPLAIGIFLLIADNRDVDIKFGVLMLVWFIAAMYTTTQGVRFTLVLVPSLAVLIGTFAGVAKKHLAAVFEQEFELPRKIVIPVVTVLFLLILISPINAAHRVGLNEVPSMNDAWYESLTNIKDASNPDAIITSWWDFGHWFKAIAERPVTFDGGSQNTPMAHWVGKLLLSTDEDESAAILRMLDCGSRTGFDALNEQVGDSLRTKRLLDELLLLKREDAIVRLEAEGYDPTPLIDKTHCEPPEAFLITSQDMIGKAGVWGHFGSWDFERAHIYTNLRNIPIEEALTDLESRGFSREEGSKLLSQAKALPSEQAANSWIAPWPSYTGGWVSCSEQIAPVNTTGIGRNTTLQGELVDRELAVCQTQLGIQNTPQGTIAIEVVIIDKENPEYSRLRFGLYNNGLRQELGDVGRPSSLWISANESFEKYEFDDATGDLGLLYDDVKKRVLITNPKHAGSLFTQLFYLNGQHNERFEKFSDISSFNGQRIIVWKVKW